MKRLSNKIGFAFAALSVAIMSMAVNAYAKTAETTTFNANTANLDDVVNPVVDLINGIMPAVIAIVGAAGTLFCVFLGVKFARADDPQEHEKAKKALRNAIIGFVLIFALMLALKIALPRLTHWVEVKGN